MLARIVLCVLTLAACSDQGVRHAAGPATTASERQTSTTTKANVTVALDCRDPIGEVSAPPEGYEVVGDAIALVTNTTSETALQTRTTDESDPAHRLFAKSGLLVRTNARAELIVPAAWHHRLSFRWGNTGEQAATERLVVGPCPGAADWIAFPGGYLVADPACVDVVVRTEDGDHRVSVGIGKPCPGQHSAPEPTDA